MNDNQHLTAPDQAHPLVGREIIAESHGAVVDVSIELLPRPTERNPDTPALEPPDKAIIGVRVDRRDATSPPIHLCLESGPTRQLAATLTKAADIADDIDNTH
jgi:hypothetical protein